MYSFLYSIKKIDFIEYRQGGTLGGLCTLTAPRGADLCFTPLCYVIYTRGYKTDTTKLLMT